MLRWRKGLFTNGKPRHIRASFTAKRARELEFERLYLESYRLVYGFVRARMSRDADAEDVVAEAFLKAARSFAAYDPTRAKFSTWVLAIAKNCMASHYRKEKTTITLDEIPQSASAISGGQDAIDDQDLARRLLATIDDEECELVLLKYRDGMRNVDIANKLGMNPSTVSTKLANALSKMREAAERGMQWPT